MTCLHQQEKVQMIGLTKRIAAGDGVRVLACAALAGTMLVACKHSNTTADTKGLWIANANNVVEYLPSQLKGGTSAAVPHITLKSTSIGTPQGVTFDKAGNLWVMDPGAMVNGAATPALLEFSAAEVAAMGTNNAPTPIATITYTNMKVPQQSVFDANGNQWVADHDGNQVLVFSAAQLAATGDVPTTPVIVLTSGAFNAPLGIAFDSMGNLWVANNGGIGGNQTPAGTSIVEFTAAQLGMVPASGMLTPDLMPTVTLNDDGNNSIQAPWALSFDASGNLWSSNANAPNTLVEFAKASLAATGAPVPAVTISPMMVGGNATLDGPNGLCFDNAGDLAAANSAGAFGIAFFTKSQLVTGMPTPNTFIVGAATTLGALAGCNFGPAVN
jgi:hypothetical protein